MGRSRELRLLRRRRPRVGVFAGISISTYLIYNLLSHPDMLETAGGLLVKHTNDKDYVATRVSYKLNLRGPSMTVQTGCSTSLVATHLACQSLLEGVRHCDCRRSHDQRSAVSRLPVPRRWDRISGWKVPAVRRQGERNCADGRVGVVVLKRLSAAIVDGDHIHAVIRGTAVNNDGSAKVGFTAPGVEGQAAVIREAMAIAGVESSRHFVHPRPRHRDASRGPDRDRCALAGVRTWNPRRPLCDRISEGQHRTREYGRGCGRAHDDRARPRTSASTADGEFRAQTPSSLCR